MERGFGVDVVGRWRRIVRAAAVIGAVTAMAVITAGGAAIRAAGDDSAPTAGTLPTPPAGAKWVGIGTTVFAVPASWSMWPWLYCQTPDGQAHLTIREPGFTVSCTPVDRGIPNAEVVALTDDAGTITIDDRRIARTRTTLPSGWLAVPAAPQLDGDPSADDESHALEEAGFHVVREELPDWGAQPSVTTDPEIGAPARLGSTVTVFEPRPAPAAAYLTGRLLWVGGPAPGATTEHAGTVHLVAVGRDWYVPTDAGGRWTFAGAAGTYTVTASSPGYLGGRLDRCGAKHQVMAVLTLTTGVDVYCQLR